jgi:alpha/beta superfamily hydrolase
MQGDLDSVVSEELVHELAQKLSKQKYIKIDYRMIAGADHFFREKIDRLNEEIDDYLKATFNHQPSSAQNTSVKTRATSKSTAKKLFLE